LTLKVVNITNYIAVAKSVIIILGLTLLIMVAEAVELSPRAAASNLQQRNLFVLLTANCMQTNQKD
jgi:hypothetical protein